MQWEKKANLCTYFQAVERHLQKMANRDPDMLRKWRLEAKNLGWKAARALADNMGCGKVYWCAEKPRTREGYYRFTPGVETVRKIEVQSIGKFVWKVFVFVLFFWREFIERLRLPRIAMCFGLKQRSHILEKRNSLPNQSNSPFRMPYWPTTYRRPSSGPNSWLTTRFLNSKTN